VGKRHVGFVVNNIYNAYLNSLWPGAAAYAEKHGIDLVLLPGSQMNSPVSRDLQESYIYDFLASGRFEGFIFASNVFGSTNTVDALKRFCERFAPVPYVCLGSKLPGAPTVLIDNSTGLREMVRHFTDVHGFKKFGYIRGPLAHPEAEERYRPFRAVLSERGVPFDESLLHVGDFNAPAGIDAARAFARRKGDVEAVIAANDIMAVSCFQELGRLGIRVPDQMALGGFDDLAAASFIASPLTTVRQPLFELSYKAMELLARRMDGEARVEDVTLETEAIIRRSCGCLSHSIEGVQEVIDRDSRDRREPRDPHQDLALELFHDRGEFDASILNDIASRILGYRGSPEELRALVASIDKAMHALPEVSGEQERWNDFLNHVYSLYIKEHEGECEPAKLALFQKMRIYIGDFMERKQAALRASNAQEFVRLQDALQTISGDYDFGVLMDGIRDSLLSLDISTFVLCLYSERVKRGTGAWTFPPKATVRAALEDGHQSGMLGKEFDPRKFLPEGRISESMAGIYVTHPLYFGDVHFGYIVMRMGPRNGTTYETLRAQISSSLQAAYILIDQNEQEESLKAANERLRALAIPMLDAIKGVSGIAVERISRLEELLASAKEASAKLVSANESASRVMDDAKAMNGLIAIIEDISVNVNLLSINASIESARAGANGKGFAVIAGEIRKMASGTADNARKASLTLASALQNIGSSKEESGEAVKSFDALRSEIQALSSSFSDISDRMEELERMSRDMSSVLV